MSLAVTPISAPPLRGFLLLARNDAWNVSIALNAKHRCAVDPFSRPARTPTVEPSNTPFKPARQPS
jgi:hypothetical protein